MAEDRTWGREILTGGPANPAGPGGPVSPRSPCEEQPKGGQVPPLASFSALLRGQSPLPSTISCPVTPRKHLNLVSVPNEGTQGRKPLWSGGSVALRPCAPATLWAGRSCLGQIAGRAGGRAGSMASGAGTHRGTTSTSTSSGARRSDFSLE